MAISFLPVKILKGSPFKSVFFCYKGAIGPQKSLKIEIIQWQNYDT